MNILLITTLISLLFIVLLPSWLITSSVSKDQRVIKGIYQPGNRKYTVILPDCYDGKRFLPLVVGLHYGGHGFPYYGEIFLKDIIEPAFKSLDAILIAPDCPAEDWTQDESVAYIHELLHFIFDKYPIDRTKILLTGYSMGGIGAWHIGSRDSDPFTAMVIMAARPPDFVAGVDWKIPIYVIHVKNDELFSVVDTTRVINKLENAGVDIKYQIIEDVSHFETYRFLPALNGVRDWIIDKWDSA